MPSIEHTAPPRIYVSPIEVREKLISLGIARDVLARGAQAGFAERANANRFDPKTAGGYDAWRYPTRYIRQAQSLIGWRLDDPKNLPLVISDEHQVILTVSSGDEQTGQIFGRDPKTKNKKGSVLKAAVERDFSQPDLFGNPLELNKFIDAMKYPIWILLLYITEDIIRAELSRPLSLDGNSQVDSWSERIILDIPTPDTLYDDEAGDDSGPDILPQVTFKI